ncbi:hypothetical protein GWK47_007395 [Chionoecetes opilio]|uniref:Uncharacterized protein n=1 Tax=Chionoecetes opilio TaxID=41210 RepID=A0A8J4Y8B0_CHIOP|nr:hypothetical protein GWK47_007395 [Chionoecetes opilio]
MKRYLARAQHNKGLQDCAERGKRYKFVKKFLKIFRSHQRRTAADVLLGCPTTVKGMQRTGIPNTSPLDFPPQNTVPPFPGGQGCVDTAVPLIVGDCLTSSEPLALCYLKGLGDSWTSLSLTSTKTKTDLKRVPHQPGVRAAFSGTPPSTALGWKEARFPGSAWAQSETWVCLSQAKPAILKGKLLGVP